MCIRPTQQIQYYLQITPISILGLEWIQATYTLSLFRRGTVFSDKLAIDTPVVVPRQLDYELVQIRLTQRPRLGKLKLLKLVLNLVERVGIVRESRSDGALSILLSVLRPAIRLNPTVP